MKLRKSHRRLGFWLGVAVVAELSRIGFNIAADKLPLPGLQELNDYSTRRA